MVLNVDAIQRRDLSFACLIVRMVLLSTLACSSCSSMQYWYIHRLKIAMPKVPAAWAHIAPPVYELVWTDEDGRRRSSYVPSGQHAVITVARGVKQAVLAFPIVFQTRLKPAGGLYPENLKNSERHFPSDAPDELIIDFEGGYIAAVAEIIAKAGYNPWNLKLSRLNHDLRAWHYDPWAVDPALVASRLIDGTYSSAVFSKKAEVVTLSLPPPADWLPASPFLSLREEEGSIRAEVNEGIYLFHRSNQIALVFVSEGRAVLQVSCTSSGQDDGENRALPDDAFD